MDCDSKGRFKPVLFRKQEEELVNIPTFRFKNGEARIKGYLKSPGLYVLTNEHSNCHFPFLIDKGVQEIIVTSDSLFQTKDLLTPIPFSYSGSEINKEFHEFWRIEQAQLLLQANAEYLQWLQNNKKSSDYLSESQKQFLVKEKEARLTTLNQLKESTALNYLEKNPDSHLALDYFLSYVFTPKYSKLDEKHMEYYISLMGDTLKQTEVYKEILKKYKTCQHFCIGKTPPPFELPNCKGELVSLNDCIGNITLVNFWVLDCEYCKEENVNLHDIYLKYHEEELEIVGIAFERDKINWQNYIDEQAMPWQQLLDTTAAGYSKIIQEYGGLSIPTSFLLDKEGKVVAKSLRCPTYADDENFNINTQLKKVFGF